MTTHNHSMHADPPEQAAHSHAETPQPHNHAALHGHSHGGTTNGLGAMRLLGMISHHLPTDAGWLSNYRSQRITPVSNHVVIMSFLLLLVGAALRFIFPTSLVTLIALIVAAIPFALVIIVGGYLTLFRNQQRKKARRLIVDSVKWTGAEMVLDVGCGTGMTLNGCAQKLTTGKAIGADLWQQEVGGNKQVLLANAKAEGVADRIHLHDMDARKLSFKDDTFDVVVSSFALHHIGSTRAEIAQAVEHMLRVVKPGGTLSLVDIGPMIDIAEGVVAQSGMSLTRREDSSFFRFITVKKL
jgi:2-polyprenyl-3-methyl-5-hydroxy-6-metoxy-1,4-benzoquinol methylase